MGPPRTTPFPSWNLSGKNSPTVVSKPDNNMYEAMNKGIKRATGDVIAILNSDDLYADPDVLARVASAFQDQAVDCVYGDLHYVDASNLDRVVRNWQSKPCEPRPSVGVSILPIRPSSSAGRFMKLSVVTAGTFRPRPITNACSG